MKPSKLKQEVINRLKQIFDPELPVNIWDLGLIYEITIVSDNTIKILMTLTTPNCPEAETLPPYVQKKIKEIKGIQNVEVEITWTPHWNKDMMSEEALLDLGFL